MAGPDRLNWPRRIDHWAIATATLAPPPKKLGVTHWSFRLLASRLEIDHSTVEGLARVRGRPVAGGHLQVFTDPKPTAKVVDQIGFYLVSLENAMVLYVDEKSQIQALERTASDLPM